MDFCSILHGLQIAEYSLEYYKTGNYPLKHITEEPVEYKKKFSLVKQNLDRNLTFKKLTSVIVKISHLKQTIG